MNKKNNRKGFTIVELVIVIAVIAILATVLVPTFGNVIEKAKNSALVQELKNEYTEFITKTANAEGFDDAEVIIEIDGKYYYFSNGQLIMDANNEKPVEYPSSMEGKKYWNGSAMAEYEADGGETGSETGDE